jgi:MraZ protein
VFRGQFRHTIDPKGRLSIPAKFRERLSADFGPNLVVVPINSALEVHPLAAWQATEARVANLSKFDPDVRRFRQQYLSLGEDVALDPQGRIQVKQEYRERVGLLKDVMIVGMGDSFEVWDAERWVMHQSGEEQPLEDLFARIAAKGV